MAELATGIAVLAVINALTALAFWSDKQRAIAGQRRIRESDLLMLAAVGGSPGALFARHTFRHKSCKQPFSIFLILICMIQIGLIIGFAVP